MYIFSDTKLEHFNVYQVTRLQLYDTIIITGVHFAGKSVALCQPYVTWLVLCQLDISSLYDN